MAEVSQEAAAFEASLREDLPRGLTMETKAIGLERGLTSRWLSADEMVGELWENAGSIILGTREGRVVGWNDDRHMLTIAGSRAGKGVSLIIPNLIAYTGSAVVIDPKGENAARTANRRKAPVEANGLGQIVHVLDPFGESGLESSSFNPLDALKATDDMVVEDIGLFADALVTHPETGERHWTETAQAVIRALILMVVADPMFLNRRNLVTVRKLLTLTDPAIDIVRDVFAETAESTGDSDGEAEQMTAYDALIKLLRDQAGHPNADICVGMSEQLAAMGTNELGSVLSTARTQTQWLDSPKMAAVLRHTTDRFELGDLKRKKMTIYLCLPSSRMATHARWLRLITLLAIGAMERVKIKPKPQVLFVLDEFPVLGYMQSIETAAGLMAGFGVKLWPIVQNIGQLKQHYSRSWETFIANAGVVTAFGVIDSETLKALTDNLGRTGIIEHSLGGITRSNITQGGPAHRETPQTLPLLAEDEIRRVFGRKQRRLLVFNAEENPAIVRRFLYYEDEQFKGLYDRDPDHESRP